MKDAAAALNINYSTAKTIVQTFRRERRVTRKRKQTLETKKGLKREHHLQATLSHCKLANIFLRILQNETANDPTTCKAVHAEALNAPGTTIPTASGTPEATPEDATPLKTGNKAMTRAHSAAEMCLVSEEEKGPKPGDMSRPTQTGGESFPPQSQKPVFVIYTESNPEDQFKDQIDYRNLVRLRTKKESPVPVQVPDAKLPPLTAALALALALCSHGCTGGSRELPPLETFPTFNFAFYTQSIWTQALCPYAQLNHTVGRGRGDALKAFPSSYQYPPRHRDYIGLCITARRCNSGLPLFCLY